MNKIRLKLMEMCINMWPFCKCQKQLPVVLPPEEKKSIIKTSVNVEKGRIKFILRNKKILYSEEITGYAFWNTYASKGACYIVNHRATISLERLIQNINASPVFARINNRDYVKIKDIKSMHIEIKDHILEIKGTISRTDKVSEGIEYKLEDENA